MAGRMQPDYTLPWILPFVRESLRGQRDFTFDKFVDGLWPVLKIANVPGIVEVPSTRQGLEGRSYYFEQCSQKLSDVTTEAFFHLLHTGLIIPAPPTRHVSRGAGVHTLTERGLQWSSGVEPLPEDYDGYLKLLRALVPNLDSTTEQYVSEGLISFGRGTYFAAAVMVGAAAEKSIYLLADSMLNAIKDPARKTRLEKLLLGERSFNQLFQFIQAVVSEVKKNPAVDYSVTQGADTHLFSLFEAIRVQRNEAVHPMKGAVTPDSVRHSFNAFPHALKSLDGMREWFLTHPQSI
jgi:hypothetical protein